MRSEKKTSRLFGSVVLLMLGIFAGAASSARADAVYTCENVNQCNTLSWLCSRASAFVFSCFAQDSSGNCSNGACRALVCDGESC